MSAQENILPIEGAGRGVQGQSVCLGGILAEQGKLGPADIKRVLALQQAKGLRFGQAALRLRLITADDLRRAIAKQYDLPHLLPDNPRVSKELVVAYEPFHRCGEEIRALRTQLLHRWVSSGTQRRMLAIVSVEEGDGRSYVAANLAVAFSQLGERTLLIDTDLRKPRQHRIFDVADRVGVSAVLAGRANGQAVVPIPELGPLSVLPAGQCPPNPLELLSRDAFALLLDAFHTEFDVILFDTPPAKLYADAHSVAFRAGSALVLARKDHTPLAGTSRLTAELSDAGATVMGTAFNAF